MKVPFQLRRRADSAGVAAALCPGQDAGPALALCAQVGLDPTDRIFATAQGPLVLLDRPPTTHRVAAIQLRALGKHLLIPHDADLLPALLDDEIEGLTRDRGLVFLPNGTCLSFDYRTPLELTEVIATTRRPPRAWSRFPETPRLPERVVEFELPSPPEETGGAWALADTEPVGVEDPRPKASGPSARALGGAAMGLGRSLMWLGQSLGLPGLAKQGAKWVQQAVEIAPRLSEAVMGRQAAALQALLKEFREGDPERALRRALPIGDGAGPRGGAPDTGSELPENETRYSLDGLLGGTSRGRPTYWVGSQDLMAELAREYRKQANEAITRGDFRRAALIQGRLLRDFRAAAHTLSRGGLHRDAAIVYLTRLDDKHAAARAYEQAGDHDRAVRLYRQMGAHVEAGDLLRKIGEEDKAIAAYLMAAELLAVHSGGHLAAGDLLQRRAGRPDLAAAFYQRGWDKRPAPNDLACVSRLVRVLADQAEYDGLLTLVGQAQKHLAAPGHDPAAVTFFNEVVLLSRTFPMELKEELHDRALMALAAKLSQGVRAGGRPGAALG